MVVLPHQFRLTHNYSKDALEIVVVDGMILENRKKFT